MDANASVGHDISAHISDFQAGPPEPKSEPFESFVCEQDLWLPATFQEHQVGLGSTWTHSSGKQRRIDYVGLPRCWSLSSCCAWVSDVIDPLFAKIDHAAACVGLSFQTEFQENPRLRAQTSIQLDQGKTLDLAVLATTPDVPFDINVHTHANRLQSCLVDALANQQHTWTRKPKKKTMSDSTWELVLQKRQCRRHLAQAQKLQNKTRLEIFFSIWRHQRQSSDLDTLSAFDRILVDQDRLVAQTLESFRALGEQVTQALRADDLIFFQTLAAEGADLLSPWDVKQFWQVLRRSLHGLH